MARRLQECSICRRSSTGSLEPGCGLGVACLSQVVREERGLRVDQPAIVLVKNRGNPSVDGPALALHHRRVRRLLQERVAELVSSTGKLNQNVRRHQTSERAFEIGVSVQELPQHVVVEDPADRRGPLEHQLKFRAESIEPSREDPLQR